MAQKSNVCIICICTKMLFLNFLNTIDIFNFYTGLFVTWNLLFCIFFNKVLVTMPETITSIIWSSKLWVQPKLLPDWNPQAHPNSIRNVLMGFLTTLSKMERLYVSGFVRSYSYQGFYFQRSGQGSISGRSKKTEKV